MYWRSNRKSGSPSRKIGSAPYFYFRFGHYCPFTSYYFRFASRLFVADSATPITPSVEEYWNQHQPTPLLDFLRHVNAMFIGASSIGGNGENGFSRKKVWAQNCSATKFRPRIGGTMLEFFFETGEDNFPLAPKNLNCPNFWKKILKNGWRFSREIYRVCRGLAAQ